MPSDTNYILRFFMFKCCFQANPFAKEPEIKIAIQASCAGISLMYSGCLADSQAGRTLSTNSYLNRGMHGSSSYLKHSRFFLNEDKPEIPEVKRRRLRNAILLMMMMMMMMIKSHTDACALCVNTRAIN